MGDNVNYSREMCACVVIVESYLMGVEIMGKCVNAFLNFVKNVSGKIQQIYFSLNVEVHIIFLFQSFNPIYDVHNYQSPSHTTEVHYISIFTQREATTEGEENFFF
jgi:hypothetical protein